MQETFRRVAQGLRGFRYRNPQDTFRGWLFTISRNQIRDWSRRRSDGEPNAEGGSHALRRLHEVPDWISLDEPEPAADPETEAALMRRALRLVESDFNATTWRAFWQVTIDGG